MAAVHNIVIIGASFGGIPVAHGLLKDVLPQLSATGKEYKVIMISPSEEFFWKVGSPRTIVNPTALPVEKVLVPIADGFKNYKPEQYQFIKAFANEIDPSSKTIQLSTNEAVHYDSLVIASGTSFESPIWSVAGGSEPTRAALKDIHERLPNAESVVVAGGGAAGTETAGELGETYGNKKQITFLTGMNQPLNRLNNKKVGADAESRLERMGVKVVNNVKVSSATKQGNKDVLQLSNGEIMTVDVYIEATGDRPNSRFVPGAWLNEKRYVKADPQTLRLDVSGETGVYVIGSVASYSDGSILDAKFTVKPILESIKIDLQGGGESHDTNADMLMLTTFTESTKRTKNIYKKITSDMQFVPLGSTQGVGVVMGWKIPSFMVKMAKSKDFMIGQVPKLISGTG